MNTFADPRVGQYMLQKRNVRNKDELDQVTADTWEGIGDLFNNIICPPERVSNFPNGIQHLHVSLINRSVLLYKRS